MEPITLSLLALGGLFALKSKNKSPSSSPSNYPSDLGFKFDCKSIEVTNEVKFEKFLEQIIKEAILLQKFSNPSKINFCNFLDYCYNKILTILNNRDPKIKCSATSSEKEKSLDEKIIILYLKGQISNVYTNLIFNPFDDSKAVWIDDSANSSTYKGIMIDKELYTIEDFQNNVKRPCFDELINKYNVKESDIKHGLLHHTKKYPNPDYEIREISGIDLVCISNNINFTTAGHIVIYDWEKFETYLRNIVKNISSQIQFSDPYKLNLESFIDEYLKRLNSYCNNSFNNGTLTSRMTLIIYVLIQYGFDFYIDDKFGIEDSPIRKKYFENYFYPEFEKLKLNPKFSYIDDLEVVETEKHMKENKETNGWV